MTSDFRLRTDKCISWTSSMQHNECKSDHCEIAVCTSFSHSLHGIMGRIHDHKAYTHQNGMCSISCDFVICLVPVWEAKVIVLNLEVQVRENELQHHSACRLSHCSDWHLECSESSVVCQLHTSGVAMHTLQSMHAGATVYACMCYPKLLPSS